MIITVVFLNGCASTVKTPVLKPAEINLRGIDNIAIGDISGNVGYLIADLLTTRLFESDKYTVVDRQNLYQIMDEQRLSAMGAIDTNTAADIGKLIGAGALITGSANLRYKLERFKDDAWKDKKGRWHQAYYIEGIGRITSTLKVLSLTTGEVLAIKTITKEGSQINCENNQWPSRPCKDEIVSEIVNETLDTFMKMIAPYTVYVYVNFENSKMPESEIGVSFAELGMWMEALEQFKKAKNNNPSCSNDWYNLGLAYKYNFMFYEAIEVFKEANKIEPSTKYTEEIVDVRCMQAEREMLVHQRAVSPEN